MAFERTASSFAASPAGARPEPFAFGDFLKVLTERSRLILRVAALVVAATAIVLMLLPSLYSSSAVVMLDQRKNNVADLSAVLSALPTDPASLQNQIQILTSRDLALKVIAKLGLYNDPEFNPALAPGPLHFLSDLRHALHARHAASDMSPEALRERAEYTRDEIVSGFLKHLDVTALGLSTAITIKFTSKDPQKAARIANEVADAYVEDQIDTKSLAARKATGWLADRIHQLAAQVQSEESAVEQYKALHNLTETSAGTSLTDQQLAAINTQLVDARSDLAEKEATFARVNALVRSGDPADISQVVSSPLIIQLRTQEADLVRQEADLSTRYGPRHPKMLAIETQKRDLDQKIAEEAARIAGSIANDVIVAKAHIASLQASLKGAEKVANTQNLARVKLQALESSAAASRTMYEAFVQRLRATQDQGDIQDPDVRVISPAPIPAAPSSPKRMLLFVASIPAGLLLGILAALLAERFEAAPAPAEPRRFRAEPVPVPTPAPTPVMALPPVLADLPATADWRAADAVLDQPHSPYARAVAALAQKLASDRGGVAVFTALDNGLARSVIALGVARAAARAGLRVVLIDGDFARASLVRALGPAPKTGLAEVLRGTAPPARAFLRDPRSQALLLAVAQPQPDAAALWSSSGMASLIGWLRRNCDLVVVDGAVEAARLGGRAILVVPAATEPGRLGAALRSLEARGAAPAGLVTTR